MLILKAEDLRMAPGSTLRKTLRFLGVPDHELSPAGPRNVGDYERMSPGTREELKDYFQNHNRRLYEMLNVDPLWA